MYSFESLTLKMRSRSLTILMKISVQTYLVDMPMFVKTDMSRPNHSFSVTFRDVHTYTTVCMPPSEWCKEIGLIKMSLRVCLTRVLMGQRDAVKKLRASRLHKRCPLYSPTPVEILALGIIWFSTNTGATFT